MWSRGNSKQTTYKFYPVNLKHTTTRNLYLPPLHFCNSSLLFLNSYIYSFSPLLSHHFISPESCSTIISNNGMSSYPSFSSFSLIYVMIMSVCVCFSSCKYMFFTYLHIYIELNWKPSMLVYGSVHVSMFVFQDSVAWLLRLWLYDGNLLNPILFSVACQCLFWFSWSFNYFIKFVEEREWFMFKVFIFPLN